MGQQTEKRNQFIRAAITALIMPVTILAGYALGSLVCIIVGIVFYGNPDFLFTSSENDSISGKVGFAVTYTGALIGAVLPWIVLYVIKPESKKFRTPHNRKSNIINV